jgi:xanthine dehydrogenase molybdopterin-binding subunit B
VQAGELAVCVDEFDGGSNMRMIFSVLALLVVVAVVMKLAATQTKALSPAATAGTAGQGPGVSAAQHAADQVKKALEQGAAMRAEEAASQ